MPYVYKYTDRNDGIVKYVGIIRKDTNFPKRFTQHRQDEWANKGDWKIEYLRVNSICEAEALEGHFIALYGTDEWFNKAKTQWGRLSFFVDVHGWEEFRAPKNAGGKNREWSCWENTWNVRQELYRVQSAVSKLYEEMKNLEREYTYAIEEADKDKFSLVREWVKERVNLWPVYDEEHTGNFITANDAYRDFLDYQNIPEQEVDIDDFWDKIYRTSVIGYYHQGGDSLLYASLKQED